MLESETTSYVLHNKIITNPTTQNKRQNKL